MRFPKDSVQQAQSQDDESTENKSNCVFKELTVISDESEMLVSMSSLMALILLVYGKRSVLLFEEC